MRLRLLEVSTLVLLCVACGCQSSKPKAQPPPEAASAAALEKKMDLATRNNALALLDDLLSDEKNVSKILLIKHNSDELGKLVKDISNTAGKGAERLETVAKKDGVNLKQLDLPPGEVATRKAISKTKEHALLHSKDEEFQFQLLLTQSEGLNYGAHLAMVAAENEPQAEQAREFLSLSSQLRNLEQQVLEMLRAKK